MYAVKSSWWLPLIAPRKLVWKMPVAGRPTVYLTFDDGPHPVATPFVLSQLDEYGAKATFFCIGKCVAEYPEIFSELQLKGHTVGNHTYNHLNGWKTSGEKYLSNVAAASELIPGRLFRPPYGKISRRQAKELHAGTQPWKVYMWSVLSGDFDTKIGPEDCLNNVLRNIKPGFIIVFHDSQKAWDRLKYALPRVLEYCKSQGWEMKGLPQN